MALLESCLAQGRLISLLLNLPVPKSTVKIEDDIVRSKSDNPTKTG